MKATYQSPSIVEYGTVGRLTQGRTGSGCFTDLKGITVLNPIRRFNSPPTVRPFGRPSRNIR